MMFSENIYTKNLFDIVLAWKNHQKINPHK